MVSQFHFKNYEADESTQAAANLALSEVLDFDLDGSRAVGVLEKQGEEYRCSMEVYSRQGPFMATAMRSNPVEAIQIVEKKLKSQIALRRARWASELAAKNDTCFEAAAS
jgi:hypothetical protein